MALDAGLIGYWKLSQDCQDYSGCEHHGINHGVVFTDDGPVDSAGGSGRFDGKTSCIEIPDAALLQLGSDDFSISTWVHTDEVLDDVIGDIICKYDKRHHKGFTFNFINHPGVTTSQSNYKNLQFGIRSGDDIPSWTDAGRPGDAKFIFALAVHQGNLYAGTFEINEGQKGHVYRYDKNDKWTDCGSPDESNAVGSLAVYQGELYASTICYNSCGSLLPPAANQSPGGKIYRYDGDSQWVFCGELSDPRGAYCLTVFNGNLYATNAYQCGIFRYEGGDKWVCVGFDLRVLALSVFNGNLYAMTSGEVGVYRYEGGLKWAPVGAVKGITQYYSGVVYEGGLHVGTWPDGRVHRYNVGTECWTDCGRLGNEKEVMAMNVYNGALYAGSLPLGEVYRYDDNKTWTNRGQVDTTPHVFYRRVFSMAVYGGKLFAGTLPSGQVKYLEEGKCVTYDHEVLSGWRHLAAVKTKSVLKLYVDGVEVACSSGFTKEEYQLNNKEPMFIGRGVCDCFYGKICEMRFYKRALTGDEVKVLAG